MMGKWISSLIFLCVFSCFFDQENIMLAAESVPLVSEWASVGIPPDQNRVLYPDENNADESADTWNEISHNPDAQVDLEFDPESVDDSGWLLQIDARAANSKYAESFLNVTKGTDTHANDVALFWLPSDAGAVIVTQTPELPESFQLVDGCVVPIVYHSGVLNDGLNYFYKVDTPPEPPVIIEVTDNDQCSEGIRVHYLPGSPIALHDLYDESGLLLTAYVSGTLFQPGDSVSHDYYIQAVNGTCSANSNTVSAVDVNDDPGVASILSVIDLDACALLSGVSITFTGAPHAIRHDLLVDGTMIVEGITSPYAYEPGDDLEHEYLVRAILGSCFTDSNTVSGTDDDVTPGEPDITWISDYDGCALDGITIMFAAGFGATSHDLWVDGVETAIGITTPYTYDPVDTISHEYVVRALNGICWADSAALSWTEATSSGDLCAVDPIVGAMRSVCGASFTQGSPTSEPCRISIEPQFTHTLTRSLAVMETEVTRQMWADLLAVQSTLPTDPTNTSYGAGLNNPTQNLNWFEAVLYANLLSVQNGLERCYYTDAGFTTPIDATNYTSGPFYCDFDASGYRLPTEGEWEFSARAGTSGPFSCVENNYTSGNCTTCIAGTHPTLELYAFYCANDTVKTEPVGSKLSNPWNLRDMHGNVIEWCWDWIAAYPGNTTDYTGPATGSNRVRRGGYFNAVAQDCRSGSRGSNTPGSRLYAIGFRLVRTIN